MLLTEIQAWTEFLEEGRMADFLKSCSSRYFYDCKSAFSEGFLDGPVKARRYKYLDTVYAFGYDNSPLAAYDAGREFWQKSRELRYK